MDFSPRAASFRWGKELATGNTCAHQTENFLPPSPTSFLPSLFSFLLSHQTSAALLAPLAYFSVVFLFPPCFLLVSFHAAVSTRESCVLSLFFFPSLTSLSSPFLSPALSSVVLCCSFNPSISICPRQQCHLSSVQPRLSHFILPLAAAILSGKREIEFRKST